METTPKVVETQSRWKSAFVWGSIIAQAIVILQLTGVFKKWGLDVGLVNNIVAAALQLFVLLGVLNNPSDSQKI